MGHLDGCRDFPRLCIGLFLVILCGHLIFIRLFLKEIDLKKNAGIGNPPGSMDMRAYLLQKFGSVERQQVYNCLNYTTDLSCKNFSEKKNIELLMTKR